MDGYVGIETTVGQSFIIEEIFVQIHQVYILAIRKRGDEPVYFRNLGKRFFRTRFL